MQAKFARLCVLFGFASRMQVTLETASEVDHADDGIDNRENNEQDGNDGKSSQRLLHGFVVLSVVGLIDANELEDEVGEAAKVKNNDNDHPGLVLFASEESRSQKNENRDRDSGNGEGEFRIVRFSDNDDKLNDETQEEEKIKL